MEEVVTDIPTIGSDGQAYSVEYIQEIILGPQPTPPAKQSRCSGKTYYRIKGTTARVVANSAQHFLYMHPQKGEIILQRV